MPWIRVSESQRWAEDGIHNELLEAGKEYEVSIKCAEVFAREKWGEIIPDPEFVEDEDGDDTNPGEGNDPDDESGEQDDDPGADEESGDSGSDEDDPDDEEEAEEPRATPGAVEAAEALNVDLGAVEPTGADGVILVADVRKAAKA